MSILLVGYFSYGARQAAQQAADSVKHGIYNRAGWSVVPGAVMNEYRLFNEEPDLYNNLKCSDKNKSNYHY